MQLDQWAKDWRVTPEALADLKRRIGLQITEPTLKNGRPASESYTQSLTRLAMAKAGCVTFRNNVGALLDQEGRLVRYGLANESAAQNKLTKSSDLIGVRPVLITPEHVGTTLGQFVAVECKKGDWQPGEDKAREQAQQNFGLLVMAHGGHFQFSKGNVLY